MVDPESIRAVLTGDIVGSSRLSVDERRELHARFRESAGRLDKNFSQQIMHKPEIVRGDSWQFAVADPVKSLKIALFFRALIRISLPDVDIDSRVAIGFGTIDFVPGERISSGDGEAYRLSGEGLENLQKPFRMGLFFPDKHRCHLTDALDVIVILIDREVEKWTKAQAESTAGALIGLTQQQIASNWVDRDITQQAVGQHLERAGWSAIEAGLSFFERALPTALSDVGEQV
jgi:hypothetical protein